MTLGRNLRERQEIQWSGNLNSQMFRGASQVRHILAPTDLSSESRKAMKYAMHLAQRFQAKLTLLHVCELPGAAGSGSDLTSDEQSDQQRNRAKLSLLSLHDIIRAQYANTEPCLRCGEPCKEVISTARSLAVDLIIVSQHDYAWLRHFADKGDRKSVLRDVPCPVLIIHEHEHECARPWVGSHLRRDRSLGAARRLRLAVAGLRRP